MQLTDLDQLDNPALVALIRDRLELLDGIKLDLNRIEDDVDSVLTEFENRLNTGEIPEGKQ